MSSAMNISRPVKPKYTLFVPWTRYEFCDKMLKNINELYLPHKQMEVVFYIDTDDKRLYKRLYDWAILNQFVYDGVTLVISGNPAPPTTTPMTRRSRIVHMKQDSKQYIAPTSKFVFGIEDDSYIPLHSFDILYGSIKKAKHVGLVQGVQQGRWGLPVLGAWKLDNVDDPTMISTLPFEHETDVVPIDGGGFYCYITRTKLYKEHEYYSWAAEPGGPDATYGFELRKKGYSCLMDFRVINDHYVEQGRLIPTPQTIGVVSWRKQGYNWVRLPGGAE